MSDSSREDTIVHEARLVLGSDEEILAAGYFGLANLVVGQVAGLAAGSSAAAGLFDNDFLTAAGAAAGGAAGTKAAAEAQGVTVRMIVVVTPSMVHVLNRDTGGRLKTEVASFPRDRLQLDVKKLGLSRIITLTDGETGDHVELHGSVSWISSQAKGDKSVLEVLAE